MLLKKSGVLILTAAFLLTACSQNNQQENAGAHNQHNGAQTQQPSTGEQGHHDETNQGEGEASEIKAEWKFANQQLTSNKEEELTIQIFDKDGKVIENYKINHEKKMHLIVVSKDLSVFQHLHPQYTENGIFKVKTNFPTGGDYKLIADFIPEGGEATTKTQWVTVSGDNAPNNAIQPDTNMTKVVDGKEVSLTFDKLEAGQDVTMTWSFKDASTKQPITNLEQYLGAVGHVVILSADAEKYIHNHPLEEKATGPDAKFGTSFPHSGVYKVWGEFKHQGKVFTVPFVVKVK